MLPYAHSSAFSPASSRQKTREVGHCLPSTVHRLLQVPCESCSYNNDQGPLHLSCDGSVHLLGYVPSSLLLSERLTPDQVIFTEVDEEEVVFKFHVDEIGLDHCLPQFINIGDCGVHSDQVHRQKSTNTA